MINASVDHSEDKMKHAASWHVVNVKLGDRWLIEWHLNSFRTEPSAREQKTQRKHLPVEATKTAHPSRRIIQHPNHAYFKYF